MWRWVLIGGLAAALVTGGAAVWMNQQTYQKPIRHCFATSSLSNPYSCTIYTVGRPKYAATTPVVEYAA